VSGCEEGRKEDGHSMVNLLYRNKLGVRLERCSLYSSSLMARMASEDSCGLSVGGDLTF
jgi:hypothetical protein